jgi:predicted nucleic acid-binding protein
MPGSLISAAVGDCRPTFSGRRRRSTERVRLVCRADPKLMVAGAVPVAEVAYLSVLVVGEIRQGIERVRPRDPVQADALERWLGLMAATAKAHRLILVTRNVADVGRAGITVVNPFDPT